MIQVIEKISIGIVVTGLIFFVINYLLSRNTGNNEYYMSFSYYMLWPALYYQYKYFRSSITKYLLISGMCFISMALVGSRGALVAWSIYFIFSMLTSRKRSARNFLLIILVSIVCLLYKQVIGLIATLLPKIGITSRSIMLLVNSKFFTHDSGRGELLEESLVAIHNHPFIGNGIAANYRLYNGFPHNLMIELVLNFGWILGILIVCIILYMAITAYLRSSDKLLFMIFVCAGFVPILVSGTYLTEVSFWIFIGYCLRKRRVIIRIFPERSYLR